MKPVRRANAAGLALAALVAALPASGQELHTADPYRRDPAGRQRTRWSFDLGAEEGYESNVPYTDFVGQDDFVTRATARLGVIAPIRRGLVELAGEGGLNVYRTVQGLNRFTWGGAGRLDHRFNRRSQIEAEARVSENYARTDPRLLVNGSLPPLTLTRSDSLDVLWRQGLSQELQARVVGRAERFRFDAPGLQNGWTADGRAGLEYSFNRRFALGVAGEYARTATSPSTVPTLATPEGDLFSRTYEVVQAVGTLRYEIVKRLELSLEAGYARFQSVLSDGSIPATTTPTTTTTATDGSGTVVPAANGPVTSPVPLYAPTGTPTVAANLTGIVGRHTIGAIASQRVEQTYGVGAVGINRTLGLNYRLALARWAVFNLSGAYNHNSSPDLTVLSSGRVVMAGFDFTLPAGVSTRLNYSYWDRVDAYRDWNEHMVTVGISKRFEWW